jgi:hypothetical protein
MAVQHNKRITTNEAFSKETLELMDWLIDGITLAANHPDLEKEAVKIGRAKKEVAAELVRQGGVPLAVQRELS